MSMTRASRSAATPGQRSQAGYTLLELLVALVIAGIVATSILQVIDGNGRFVAHQSSREEVQQSGRAALEMISSDLRTAGASAITERGANSVAFYLPRAFGVLCTQVVAGESTAYVLFPAGHFPEDFLSAADHWGVAVEQTTDPAVVTGAYVYRTGVRKSASGGECDSLMGGPLDASRYQEVALSADASLIDAAALGAGGSAEPGTQVMIFEAMRYDVATAEGKPGRWIRRMSGMAEGKPNMVPLAGPVPTDSSLAFRYLRQDGQPAAAPSDIQRIHIWMEVESRARQRQNGEHRAAQVDTSWTDVALRNQ